MSSRGASRVYAVAFVVATVAAPRAFASQAPPCGPGQATGCTPGAQDQSAIQDAPNSPEIAACSAAGRWVDRWNGVAIIKADMTGTLKYPYCNSTHTLTVVQSSTGFTFVATWHGGSECQGMTASATFDTCDSASGPFTNADGGSGWDSWTRDNVVKLAIQPDAPVIRTASRVETGRVLTHSKLTVTVTDAGQPAPGVTPTLQSDRGANDTITGPSTATDALGVTTAQVETRVQPGPSTITSADPEIGTSSPGTISWLPARYESPFLITCYVASLEANFMNSPVVHHVPGLPPDNQYHRGFLNDTRLQGSGLALDGTYIHYDGHGRYSLQNCALTSTGACAVDGTTSAVDPTVIPRRSTISIDTLGSRLAQDVGGRITGYHIDVFYGTRRDVCLADGRRNLGVEFTRY